MGSIRRKQPQSRKLPGPQSNEQSPGPIASPNNSTSSDPARRLKKTKPTEDGQLKRAPSQDQDGLTTRSGSPIKQSVEPKREPSETSRPGERMYQREQLTEMERLRQEADKLEKAAGAPTPWNKLGEGYLREASAKLSDSLIRSFNCVANYPDDDEWDEIIEPVMLRHATNASTPRSESGGIKRKREGVHPNDMNGDFSHHNTHHHLPTPIHPINPMSDDFDGFVGDDFFDGIVGGPAKRSKVTDMEMANNSLSALTYQNGTTDGRSEIVNGNGEDYSFLLDRTFRPPFPCFGCDVDEPVWGDIKVVPESKWPLSRNCIAEWSYTPKVLFVEDDAPSVDRARLLLGDLGVEYDVVVSTNFPFSISSLLSFGHCFLFCPCHPLHLQKTVTGRECRFQLTV